MKKLSYLLMFILICFLFLPIFVYSSPPYPTNDIRYPSPGDAVFRTLWLEGSPFGHAAIFYRYNPSTGEREIIEAMGSNHKSNIVPFSNPSNPDSSFMGDQTDYWGAYCQTRSKDINVRRELRRIAIEDCLGALYPPAGALFCYSYYKMGPAYGFDPTYFRCDGLLEYCYEETFNEGSLPTSDQNVGIVPGDFYAGIPDQRPKWYCPLHNWPLHYHFFQPEFQMEWLNNESQAGDEHDVSGSRHGEQSYNAMPIAYNPYPPNGQKVYDTDQMYFQVSYVDNELDEPTYEKNVYINSSPHTLSLNSGYTYNGTYRYPSSGDTSFSPGLYYYFFYFKSKSPRGDWVRLPSSGSYSFDVYHHITVTHPNDIETLYIDSLYDIRWNHSQHGNTVYIKYSTDGGSSYPYIITASTPDDGTYRWGPIPNRPTTQGRIKITSNDWSDNWDISDNNFTIKTFELPDLIVSEPRPDNDGATTFYVGQEVDWYCTVTNIGEGDAASSYVGYFLGTLASDYSDTINHDATGDLSRGESSIEHDKYTFTSSDIGTRYLNVWADYQEEVDEEIEGNNKNSYGLFTVIQRPELLLSDHSFNPPPEGGTSPSIDVTNTGGGGSIDYTISSTEGWLSTSENDGSTPGSFTITAEANNTGSLRTGYVVVEATDPGVENSPDTVTATQSPQTANPYLSVSPDTWNAPSEGGKSGYIKVENTGTGGSINYTVATEQSWLSLSSSGSSTPDSFQITADANTGSSSRMGYVVVEATDTGVENSPDTVTVTQVAEDDHEGVVQWLEYTGGGTPNYVFGGVEDVDTFMVWFKPSAMCSIFAYEVTNIAYSDVSQNAFTMFFATLDQSIDYASEFPEYHSNPSPSSNRGFATVVQEKDTFCTTEWTTVQDTLNPPLDIGLDVFGAGWVKRRGDSSPNPNIYANGEPPYHTLIYRDRGHGYGWYSSWHFVKVRALVKFYENPSPTVKIEDLPDSYDQDARTVNISVTDFGVPGDLSGVDEVVVKYRANLGSESEVTATLFSGDSTDGLWRVDIPGERAGDTIDYYGIARDLQGKADTTYSESYILRSGNPKHLLYVDNDYTLSSILPDSFANIVDVWDYDEYGPPDSSVICFYANGDNDTNRTIIWRGWGDHALGLGLDYGVGILHSDTSWIKLLLENGGNFWLSDQDQGYSFGICPSHGQQDVPGGHWVQRYLGIKGMYDDPGEFLNQSVTAFGDASDSIFGDLFQGIGYQNPGEIYIAPYTPLTFDFSYSYTGIFDSLKSRTITNMTSDGHIISYRYEGDGTIHTGKVYNNFWPFDYICNPADSTEIDEVAVDSLIRDVLHWFGILEDTGGIEERTPQIPKAFFISQNYPNPFVRSTQVKYGLPKSCNVSIAIYNTLGAKTRILLNEKKNAGYHTIIWAGRDDFGEKVPSGFYFIRLEAGEYTGTRKLLLIR